MAERKVWTQQEDQILKSLVQVRKISKWSQISKIFSSEFDINHRNGKQCRQRYLNHLASGLKKGDWTNEQEQKLLKLHNRYGNRWAQIARHFNGRTDNCVKNQLYSRLRKSLRYINDSIEQNLRKRFKLLKINFIYKLIQMADQKYKSNPAIKTEAFQESYQLKNKILKLQCVEQKYNEQKVIALICQINQFNKKYKKRIPKRKTQKEFLSGQSEDNDFGSSYSQQVPKMIEESEKKILPKTQIQIKIIAPPIQQVNNLKVNQNPTNDKKQQHFLVNAENENSKKIDRLHSLSIQKQAGFLTMVKSIELEKKIEESINYNTLFSRVDPFVHGQLNQNRIKAKHSSSIEQVPNIMVDIGNKEQSKQNELKVSRLRSFGSIEESYQFQKDRDCKPSSFDKQFLNKEQVDSWLSNIQ